MGSLSLLGSGWGREGRRGRRREIAGSRVGSGSWLRQLSSADGRTLRGRVLRLVCGRGGMNVWAAYVFVLYRLGDVWAPQRGVAGKGLQVLLLLFRQAHLKGSFFSPLTNSYDLSRVPQAACIMFT